MLLFTLTSTLKKSPLLLLFCFLFTVNISSATLQNYRIFKNNTLRPDASIVNAFVQDNQGLMWLCTDKGLFSYNGFSVKQHLPFSTQQSNINSTKINSCLLLNDNKLCIGTDNGVLLYNITSDQYESLTIEMPTDVRSLSKEGNTLWIGSLNGLFLYDWKSRRLENISKSRINGIPHQAIYSLLLHNKELYVGTYNGLCVRRENNHQFEKILLPKDENKSNLLVNALLDDKTRNCIWVGAEGYLFQYFPTDRTVRKIESLTGNSVKSLALDSENNLLIGTDNGLYTYLPEKQQINHIVHDSRNDKSLINNIIWSIFVDKDKNAWIGTDNGFSLYKFNRTYQYVPISQITNVGDGNQFQSIFKDSRNNMWYGGTNGLIFTSSDGKTTSWYKMGDPKYPISHNRIRSIYEDLDHNLWVATDGSINRYNYQTHQFTPYNIVDQSGSRNAKWAYQLFEDNKGQLWIATCLGGVFVVDKKILKGGMDKVNIAKSNFYKNSSEKGLSDDYVLQILNDHQGNVWILTYNNEINKIDPQTGKVTRFEVFPKGTIRSSGNSFTMICDKEGFVWVGYMGGVMRIDPVGLHIKRINNERLNKQQIRLLAEENNRIWLVGSNETFVIDKKGLQPQYVKVRSGDYTSIFYDKSNQQIYLGGVDGFLQFSPEIIRQSEKQTPIILTGLYVNDRPLTANIDYQGNSIRYRNAIRLNYLQNNITFEIFDTWFSHNQEQQHLYRLKGVDNEWRWLKSNVNRIYYTNLAPGDYELEISIPDSEGKAQKAAFTFQLSISPPWYYSIWSKIVYLILFIGFLYWLLGYFRERHRNKIERIEKEKSIELSKLKIDFFTHASHEFKTPLSLILAPVSKMLMETKSPQLKRQLSLVQQNAMRLNALIEQVIGFERFDGSSTNSLILSHIEFVEFAKGIFSIYEEAFREKEIQTQFITDSEEIYVELDVLKMESILNNIISNAYKYTPQGGTIVLSLNEGGEDSQQLTITLSDSGIGIPSDELPFVFDRFYQSRRTRNIKESSGIGLHLVKNYVELHRGSISITSGDEIGTTLILTLPMTGSHTETVEKEVQNEVIRENKQTILIVEDNNEVSDFIFEALSEHYFCIIAHNGKSGWDKAIARTPDLIIMDVMMPVMDGLELSRKLKSHAQLSTIPTIMLTAKDDKITEEKSIELGIDVFISKPFDIGTLLLRIRQLLGSRQQIEERIRVEQLTAPKAIEAQSWDESFLVNITQIIEEKLSDSELNVNNLSKLSGVSTKQIYRKIKQLTGLTPVDYIRTIRLKKAAMLLNQQKFSVAEVMYLVGFSNASYFSKCFQAQFGKTPKQYMEE